MCTDSAVPMILRLIRGSFDLSCADGSEGDYSHDCLSMTYGFRDGLQQISVTFQRNPDQLGAGARVGLGEQLLKNVLDGAL